MYTNGYENNLAALKFYLLCFDYAHFNQMKAIMPNNMLLILLRPKLEWTTATEPTLHSPLLTLSTHAREGYSTHFICNSVCPFDSEETHLEQVSTHQLKCVAVFRGTGGLCMSSVANFMFINWSILQLPWAFCSFYEP